MLRLDTQRIEGSESEPEGARVGGSDLALPVRVIDPKPWASKQKAPNDWFKFYAGFNHEFANRLLGAANPNERIADPWNGSGATTTAAAAAGLTCDGFDLNPAMVIVARSRLANAAVVAAAALKVSQLDLVRKNSDALDIGSDDPLLQWFSPKSVQALRSVEQIIGLCVSDAVPLNRNALISVATSSPLGCLLYVALFQTVRSLAEPFRATNPTWLQVPEPGARLRPSPDKVTEQFKANVSAMAAAAKDGPVLNPKHHVTVSWGTSTALPLDDGSVDLVITSPPYCKG